MKTKIVTKGGKSWTLSMPKAQMWLDAIEGSGIFELEGKTLTAYSALADDKLGDEGRVYEFNLLAESYVKQKLIAREVDNLKLRLITGMNAEEIADLDLDDQAFVVEEINQFLPGEVVGEWPPKVFDITSPASTAKRLLISVPARTQESSSPSSSNDASSSTHTDGSDELGKKNSNSPTTTSPSSP